MSRSIATPTPPLRAAPRPDADPNQSQAPQLSESSRPAVVVSRMNAGIGPPVDSGARQVTVPRRQTLLALQRTVGNAAVQRLLAGTNAPPTSATSGTPIRRFNEDEHKPLGDRATGSAIVISETRGSERFELTFGDVVMLSGDWFKPHELMEIAKKPGNRGNGKGTRDEIVYALKDGLKDMKPPDPRFKKDPNPKNRGIWADWVFADDVKNAVEERFNVLASKNAAHYAAPRGRDASGEPLPTKKGESSAGGAYRSLHEEALWLAYAAGAGIKIAGKSVSVSQAMAMEAAAAHFLTDAFAAGHVRTPIGLMRDHWGGVYPLFWYNLVHKIAVDTAAEINRQDTNLVTIAGSVQAIYEEILSEVEKKVGSVVITLGDLVAKIFHDWDNEQGVAIQGGGKVFGDSHLDKRDPLNVTRARAEDAIRAGTKEVRTAANLGMSQAGLKQAGVFTHVLGQTADPAGQYAAEVLVPRPDASNPAQNWKAPTIEALWQQPIVKGATVTVGQQITKGLKPGGALYNKLNAFAAKFPPTKRKYGSTLHPQEAYRNGFFKPMVADPEKGVLSIVHWAPNTGLADKDRDDISLATGNELMKGTKRGENLKGMTTLARIRYVRELTGTSVADDEEALILEIFRTARASERPAIYQGVEGHTWTGNWIHGIRKDDDEIWNALKRYRLEILRNLINESRSGRP